MPIFKSKLDKFVKRVAENDPTLTWIDLYERNIGDAGAAKLASALSGNTHVTTLYLQSNNIGPQGASSLASALQRNTTLRELWLHNNNIGDQGASSLSSALQRNSSLRELYLYGNNIGDQGASSLISALRRNHTLTAIVVSSNNINDDLERKINRLVKINQAGPAEAAQQKDAEFSPADAAIPTVSKAPSPFFAKLMEEDDRNINFKLAELVPLIEDVHEMKIYYTVASTCERLHLLSTDDASSYVRRGLDHSWNKCTDEDAVVIFKLVLEKAHDDGRIDRADFHRYDNRAEVMRMEHAPFVKSMQEAIKANAARIKGLESNIEAVNDSVNAIKRGIRHKQKVEAATGFFGAIINAVSMGVAGNLLVAFEKVTSSVVDFGDLVHMKQIVETVGDSQVLEQFEFGIEIAAGRADKKLEDAVQEDNALVVLSASAYLVRSEDSTGVPKKDEVDGSRQDSPMFDDAELGEDDEDECPLHAAVKFGDQESLKKKLNGSAIDVNKLDSRHRTAMDLAALTGQLEVMELIEAKGGKFKYKNEMRMRALAKKRKPYAEAYLERVHGDL